MLEATRSTIFLVALLLSAVFVTGSSLTHTVKAQTNIGQHLAENLKSITDQIVAGGQAVVTETVKGGTSFLKSIGALFGVHDVRDHITAASQDLTNGNSTGATSELKLANRGLLNDSSLLYGLGQIESKLAQNSTAVSNLNDRILLAAIGADLKNIALNSEGIRTNTTTTTNS